MATRKDGDLPKGPKSAYICFTMSTRSVIAQANPDMKPAEVMKAMGEQWKDLDEKAKGKFVKMAEEDKIRYKNECDSFIQAGGKLKKKTTKARPSLPANVTLGPIKVKAPPRKKKTTIRKSEVMPDSPNTIVFDPNIFVKTQPVEKESDAFTALARCSSMYTFLYIEPPLLC